MDDIGPGNVATQLYGLLADLADGQEVRPIDVPFLESAHIICLAEDDTGPGDGPAVVIATTTGQTFHVTIRVASEGTPGTCLP